MNIPHPSEISSLNSDTPPTFVVYKSIFITQRHKYLSICKYIPVIDNKSSTVPKYSLIEYDFKSRSINLNTF